MSMSKKDFIALADAIRGHNEVLKRYGKGKFQPFTMDQIETLAKFCGSQTSDFMRGRWLDYIAGKCGSNGGAIK